MKKQYLVILVSLTVIAVMLFGLSHDGFGAKKKKSRMVKLDIKLPGYIEVGTPKDLRGVRLDPNKKKKRPVFYVPKGTKNVALNKSVLASDMDPVIGDVDQITDNDREGTVGSDVEFGQGKQYVQIDLKAKYNIYAILVWHFHRDIRVYRDVIVQVSDDPDFIKEVKTIFNNDHDNSSGLGIGKDYEYIENYKGKLIKTKGIKARYVRLYSNGSTYSEMNHYIEVDVYGK